MTANTKYPILMVHGMGFRDRKKLCYWGRIPKILTNNGAVLYYGFQDSNGSIQSNAEQIEQNLIKALEETGAEKVNIIAHSKGGLEARYIISSKGYGDKIASLTTLSTPHNGSLTVDKLLKIPNFLLRIGCKATDLWFRILGDKNPDTYSAIKALTTSSASNFNKENPNDERVYYQSYGFVMKNIFSDFFLFFSWLVVNLIEGENDGLLTPRAVEWTNFKGVCRGSKRRGISHCDEVDMRRSRLRIKHLNNELDDIPDLYLNIVKDLKNMGY